MTRLSLLLLLAACTHSYEPILRELEEAAQSSPRADLDRHAAPPLRPLPPLEARAVTLPLRESELPTVNGYVNGVALPLIVDSGTSGVWLSAQAARRAALYVPPGKQRSAIAPGYVPELRLGAFESLGLGGLRFGPGAAAVPVRGRGRHGGLGKAHGIVGVAVLSHFRVTFDFARGAVRLVPHRGRGTTNPLLAEVELNGRAFWLLVDSGANRVALEPWVAAELRLITARTAADLSKKAETTRRRRSQRARLETVVVAGRTFRDVKATIVHTYAGDVAPGGARFGGLLGLRGFGRLRWTLDFRTKKLSVDGG